jgi:hypothetical protein
MMNKKGGIFLSVVIALLIFITGVLFLPFIMDSITNFRSSLDCSNSLISNGEKITCLMGDSVVPYVIWAFTSLALGYIIGGKI